VLENLIHSRRSVTKLPQNAYFARLKTSRIFLLVKPFCISAVFSSCSACESLEKYGCGACGHVTIRLCCCLFKRKKNVISHAELRGQPVELICSNSCIPLLAHKILCHIDRVNRQSLHCNDFGCPPK
jgi:hypothetical protein